MCDMLVLRVLGSVLLWVCVDRLFISSFQGPTGGVREEDHPGNSKGGPLYVAGLPGKFRVYFIFCALSGRNIGRGPSPPPYP
jgi:hypothetical protein